MSAICGRYYTDGQPTAPDALDATMEVLSEYGRDDRAVWSEGPVALGHQMTWVTPESQGERLPFCDETTGLAITADARIDNRAELFDVLRVPPALRAGMPDSQLIVRAYAQWGEDCALRLHGDFAFAIWDSRNQRLFCARDAAGARPFYYYSVPDSFCFASDISAVLAFPGVPHRLDMVALRSLLAASLSIFYHNELTFYHNLRKLPPGHMLTVSRDGVQVRAYWQPEQVPDVRLKRDEEYIAMLLVLVQQAIGARVRSAYPVGVHISGGLDSCTVAALAARAMRRQGGQIIGFSWSPPPTPEDYPLADERAYIEAICQQEGIACEYTPMTAPDLLAGSVLDVTTQPNQTVRHELVTGRIAAQHNVRLILSGWGGDELATFNARGYFAELFARGQWRKLAYEIQMRQHIGKKPWRTSIYEQVLAPVLPAWLVPHLPPAVRRRLGPGAHRPRQEMPLPPCLQPALRDALQQVQPLDQAESREFVGVRANQIAMLNLGHLAYRIESWADHGATHGLSYAYPLLDRRVMEFCLGVPPDMYCRDGWRRYMFRRMVEGIIPPQIQWHNPKRDPAMVAATRQIAPDVQPMLLDVLRERRQSLEQSRLIDIDCLIDALADEHDNPASMQARQALWLAFVAPTATF